MRSVYLDNYRGFKNSFIPVKDINFLVGENSTGKTSFMNFLTSISSNKFSYDFTFDFGDPNYRQFRDLVSVHSDDQSYFRVGYEFIDKDGSPSRVIASYSDRDGLPFVNHFTMQDGRSIKHIRRWRKKIYSKSIHLEDTEYKNNKQNCCSFEDLILEHKKPSKGYKSLFNDDDIRTFYDAPMTYLISIESIKEDKGINIKISERSFWEYSYVDFAPIRTTPKRTYDEVSKEYSSEGDHTPYLIRKILTSKKNAEEFKSAIKKIGVESGLFQDVQIKEFGKGVNAPFELDVVLDKKALSLNSVGYGVSQSLPIIVEVINRRKNTVFSIQQPEVHLHPKAQAALGELIHTLSVKENKKFIIETHSDFMIDRFRMSYKNRKKNPESQILFFERKNESNKVHSILVDDKGNLDPNQPKSYREFFVREEMNLLGL